MIKAGAELKDGGHLIILGISEENVRRLRRGQPIDVMLGELLAPDQHARSVLIFYGKDEAALVATMRDFITPETTVRAIPHLPQTPDAPPRPRHTADDIGLDEAGQPFVLGAEAGARQAAIFDHPDHRPILLVAEHNGELAVRVYGPPSEETAALLEGLAAQYRTAIAAGRGRPQ